jgi:membrane carboxypeptidase/penicillin-binding protein PbpC
MQVREEATMAVIPDDPDSLRVRLERTNQLASLARQAVTQAGLSREWGNGGRAIG